MRGRCIDRVSSGAMPALAASTAGRGGCGRAGLVDPGRRR
jgi:hypothetical protein